MKKKLNVPFIKTWYLYMRLMYTIERQYINKHQVDGSMQDCNISSGNILEISQSCTKPSRHTQA